MNGPSRRPKIGLLGIMQELYDEMIPGITEHQAQYAAAGRRAARGGGRGGIHPAGA